MFMPEHGFFFRYKSMAIHVAVDAMGGDDAPEVIIDGALRALDSDDIQITFVGPAGKVEAELEKRRAARRKAEKMRKETDVAGPKRFGTIGWIGTGVTALGVGSLGVSAVLTAQLSDDWDALEEERVSAPKSAFEDRQTTIADKQKTARILLFSGAAVTTVGAALIATDLFTVESKPPVKAGVGPGGIIVRGRW